jgi:hypothetical protein
MTNASVGVTCHVASTADTAAAPPAATNRLPIHRASRAATSIPAASQVIPTSRWASLGSAIAHANGAATFPGVADQKIKPASGPPAASR